MCCLVLVVACWPSVLLLYVVIGCSCLLVFVVAFKYATSFAMVVVCCCCLLCVM